MTTTTSLKSKVEQQLFSKEALKLPPKRRLELLLKTKRYPIVTKQTSAEKQLKEMLDFYNLCCLMLAWYFPNEKAENNFLKLSFMASQETQSIIPERLSEAFKLLERYEDLEDKISSIQMLFYQYKNSFPELYQSYNLEDITTEHISSIIKDSKELSKDSQCVEEILRRWELIS